LDLEPMEEISAGFGMLADAFPVVPEHRLLVSRHHTGSIAHASQGHDVGPLIAALTAASGPWLAIEHGVPDHRPRSQLGQECIDHAHVHHFPGLSITVADLLGSTSFSFASASSTLPVEPAAVKDVVGPGEYVWVADSGGGSLVVPVAAAGVPRQLARRAVAELMGRRIWDWRQALALRSAR
jgi:hypothetical protein